MKYAPKIKMTHGNVFSVYTIDDGELCLHAIKGIKIDIGQTVADLLVTAHKTVSSLLNDKNKGRSVKIKNIEIRTYFNLGVEK